MNRQRGFTAVELAIVLIIFGMIMTSVMLLFGLYNKQKVVSDTDTAISTVQIALIEYKGLWGEYPCPADPTLGPGDPNYGREQRGGVLWTNPAYLTTPCTMAAPALVTVTGKDADNADGDNNPATGGDPVYIGSVPILTLVDPDGNPATADGVIEAKLSDSLSVDGWGRKLKYAVSGNLTRINTYNDFLGAIDIRDENDLTVLDPGRWAHITLTSMGENGRGAYTQDGTLVQNCVGGIPVAVLPEVATALNETENCDDNDAVFLSGLRIDKDISFNDDTMKGVFSENSNLWTWITTDQVQNTNAGNVGIGTNTPTQKLQVNGDINANRTHALDYMDVTGNPATAMTADVLGGDGTSAASLIMQCPAGQVVVSIEDNKVNCAVPFPATPVGTCSAGPPKLYLHGISSVSGIICCDPTLAIGAPGSCD